MEIFCGWKLFGVKMGFFSGIRFIGRTWELDSFGAFWHVIVLGLLGDTKWGLFGETLFWDNFGINILGALWDLLNKETIWKLLRGRYWKEFFWHRFGNGALGLSWEWTIMRISCKSTRYVLGHFWNTSVASLWETVLGHVSESSCFGYRLGS